MEFVFILTSSRSRPWEVKYSRLLIPGHINQDLSRNLTLASGEIRGDCQGTEVHCVEVWTASPWENLRLESYTFAVPGFKHAHSADLAIGFEVMFLANSEHMKFMS